MRRLTEIIVHCTATRPNWMAAGTTAQKVAEVRRWHMQDRGWADIGYHFLIDRDGTIAHGRDIERTGAHTQGRNTGTIGIALFGGHGSSATDRFADNFTPAQDRALRGLIDKLRGQYGALALSGHNDHAAKACPGFKVPNWHRGKE
ncbi:lysozyme [Microcystis phage Mae-JY02]